MCEPGPKLAGKQRQDEGGLARAQSTEIRRAFECPKTRAMLGLMWLNFLSPDVGLGSVNGTKLVALAREQVHMEPHLIPLRQKRRSVESRCG